MYLNYRVRSIMETSGFEAIKRFILYQEPGVLLGACNYPIFLSRRFHRPIYFSLKLTRIQTPEGTSVTNHKHGLNFMYLVYAFTLLWDNLCRNSCISNVAYWTDRIARKLDTSAKWETLRGRRWETEKNIERNPTRTNL